MQVALDEGKADTNILIKKMKPTTAVQMISQLLTSDHLFGSQSGHFGGSQS